MGTNIGILPQESIVFATICWYLVRIHYILHNFVREESFMAMKNVLSVCVLSVILSACCVACGNKTAAKGTVERTQTAAATVAPADKAPEPVKYTYKVTAVYPHDTEAYTQGLFWKDGFLYEGTGENGKSELRRVNLADGRVLQRSGLERRYFGEGIAYHDGHIYQLTWIAGRAFVYDADDFRRVRSFVYDGEGWGLTSDGEYLYMSDGSSKIYVRNPKTFAVERTFDVVAGGRPVEMLNELEWVDGRIWANRYLYNEIVIIDPATGYVTGIIDLNGLQAPEDRFPETDVLNGIAYDEATGSIYLTGKRWNKIYRVEITEVA